MLCVHCSCVDCPKAVLSRAELELLAQCSISGAVRTTVAGMDAAVLAWSQAEAEEAERKRKEAEIIKYKTQEHVVGLGARCRCWGNVT